MINNSSTDAAPAEMPVRAAVKWLALAAVLSISFLFGLNVPVTAQTLDANTTPDTKDSLTITSSERVERLVLEGTAPDGTKKVWDSAKEGLPTPQFDGRNYIYTINESWDSGSPVYAFVDVDVDVDIDCEFGYSSDEGWYGDCEVDIDFDISW